MTIYCPQCRSSHIALIQQAQSVTCPSDSYANSDVLKSIAGLATLGVTIARHTSMVNPLAGGIAGAVLGCLFNPSPVSQPSRPAPVYVLCCQDCQHVFSTADG
jgi:hypothetical protein